MAKTNGSDGGDRIDGDAPLIDLNEGSIKKLIARAKRKGYITYEQLNEALPQDQMTSDQLEDVMSALNEMGVNIVENEDAGEDEQPEEDSIDEAAASEEGDTGPALTSTAKKETVDRTDDPVRMYLREMGAVELLSREGEIAIAKRIEAGRDTMILGLCESPITFNAIIDWSNALNEGTMQLREILDLDAMLSKGPTAEQVENEEADGEISAETTGPTFKEEDEPEEEQASDEDEESMTERRAPRPAEEEDEDNTLSPTAPGVLANDSDVDGPSLTAVLVSNAAHGNVTLNANGSFTYTPAANYNGPDSFTYKVYDGSLYSNVATVYLTVGAVDDAPVAVNDSYAGTEDTVLNVSTGGVLANDSDIDSTGLTAVLVAGPAHGSVTLNADGTFSYTPAANYNGSDSFTYKVYDGSLYSNVATVSLSIAAVDDAPVATGESYNVAQNTPLTISAPGLLASAIFVFLESLDEFTGSYFVGAPDVNMLPLLLYTAGSGGNYQIASITALLLLVPSLIFMLIVERFLKADVLSRVGR